MRRASKKLSRCHKRHYESVAMAMQQALLVDGSAYTAITELASMFAKDNGAFDRERFKRACVPGANVRSKKNPLPLIPQNEWVRQ